MLKALQLAGGLLPGGSPRLRGSLRRRARARLGVLCEFSCEVDSVHVALES